mgnify:CR=1 FL=1
MLDGLKRLEYRGYASSGLVVRYSASGSCLADGAVLRLTSTGSCSVTASQPGNTAYSSAEAVSVDFNITEQNSSSSAGGGFFVPPIGNDPEPEEEAEPEDPQEETTPSDEESTDSQGRTKVNAGSFKGYVALYALNHEGKRWSA